MLSAYRCNKCGHVQNSFTEDVMCDKCKGKLTYVEGLVLDCDECGEDFLASDEQAEGTIAFCPACKASGTGNNLVNTN